VSFGARSYADRKVGGEGSEHFLNPESVVTGACVKVMGGVR